MDTTVVRARADTDVVVADPMRRSRPRLVVAALRAGAVGVLDVASDVADGPDGGALAVAVERILTRASGHLALRLDATLSAAEPTDGADPVDGVASLVLTGPRPSSVAAWRAAWPGRRVLVEVTSRIEAVAAVDAGADGLVVKGCESGGRVGDVESFVLLQQVAALGVPFWVQGGIGPHTAAAAVAAGAGGVVLDAQVALTRECDLDEATRRALRAMDGSETRVVGGHRIFTRPDLPAAAVAADTPAAAVAARLGADVRRDLVPIGQDGAIASGLAARHVTVGGVVAAVRRHIHDQVSAARLAPPLAPGHGVARTHGTRVPIAQGPMTRVSDQAGFARAVAEGGGLPFLALALLRGPEVRALLERTAAELGERPWGVGVLGFVPPELREEQLEAIRAVRPPFALIAGGRPSQAAPLEADGIPTYLHAPSPGLIDSFVKAGARRFVFEGRECGGHVGPRSSFVLWEAAVERLAAIDDADRLDVLFAGGIHDERSAAAIAALAAPLVERGARIGVLMGTAYLFTQEAVAHGAITPTFQQAAVDCDDTVLLETSPGHATRCARSPYVDAFGEARARLESGGATPQEMWGELESLNLGRLRIASKALVRDGDALRTVDDDEVRAEGMFMLGQVATLRDTVTSVEDLHRSVSEGSASFLAATASAAADAAPLIVREPERLDVAIVGMAAIMPGARDAESFWSGIVAGTDAVTEVAPSRWDPERYWSPDATTVDAGRRTPSKWGGFIPATGFDPLAYGLPPASLAAIEPVQLLALEVAARALADAGYATRTFDRERASVIFGAEAGTDLSAAYGLRAALPGFLPPGTVEPGRLPDALDAHLPELTEDSFPGVLANVIAGRIANRLDLGGVNYTVDAACAASLAALDLACKELASGASDLVLCGGADLHNGINDFLLFASVHALSPRGRCRTFDATADGIALGEGVACVALKRVTDAERDGDRIYAVIEAVRGASDGRALGLTAPRADGQRRALERAYAQAGRSPATLGLVEAHGTGTVVGDATELATLTEVFTQHGATPGSCVLGSVKSQIGHTKCAAGLAGVIKAAQAVYRGVLPPTLGIEEPNPRYDADKSPFRFNDAARPWADAERRAGVSAFGFGGTNFHAVLTRYAGEDDPAHGLDAWPAELVLLRARDAEAARARIESLAALVGRIVAEDPAGERHKLRDLARTVCEEGNPGLPAQVALVADDLAHLGRQLAAVLEGVGTVADGVFTADSMAGPAEASAEPTASAPGSGDVALLFPGQGSQRVGMLADLFVTFPRLRRHLRAGTRWADAVYPARAFTDEARAAQTAALTDTRVAQPALGVAGLAVADLLSQAGVIPAATAGHSYGELVALCVAGALDEAALLDLSAARGDAVHDAATRADDPGAMAAVAATATDLAPHLARHPQVVLANHNGPRQTVVAGPTAAIDALVADLRAARVTARKLPVACAFHSPLVAAARDTLADALAQATVESPRVPVWSNTTAEPYPSDPDGVRRLLADQVGEPVRFVEQIEAMYAAGVRTFVEAGPGRVLTGLVRSILGDRPHRAVACDAGGDGGVRAFLRALAELAAGGVPVDTDVLFTDRAAAIELATLPRPRPGWTVDGHLVRTADGAPVAGGLRPATENPDLIAALGGVAGGSIGGTAGGSPAHGTVGAADVVATYLENLRQTVAAERDVMLRYLDGNPGGPVGVSVPGVAAGTGAGSVVEVEVAEVGAVVEVEVAEVGAPTRGAPVDLLTALTDIVAARTGYPHDMLAPDLDLEADLSIDSIKRVEIIGEVAERIGLPGAAIGVVDDDMVEELARIKTLRGIVDWLAADTANTPADADRNADGAAGGPAHGEGDTAAGGPAHGEGDTSAESVPVPERTIRAVVELIEAEPAPPAGPDAFAGARFLVVDDGSGVAMALTDRLRAAGATVADRPASAAATTAPDLAGNGRSPEGVDGVIHLALAGAGGAPAAFAALGPATLAGARWLACVTPVHGFGGEPGFMRALAHEVPGRVVRAVAVDPALGAEAVADAVVAELAGDGPVDAIHTPTGRHHRHAIVTALAETTGPGSEVALGDASGPGQAVDRSEPGAGTDTGLGPDGLPPLPDGAVVLLTGGARGITAGVAVALARAGAAHLELVGRSPLPEDDEPADLAAAPDLRALRAAVLARGEARTPGEVEAACRGVLAARAIRATIADAAAHGATVRYHQADVADDTALAAVVTDIYERHDRLDGVVHGAGVIEDRTLADKTTDSFIRVYRTKVDAARTLLGAVRADVGFVVLFASVSGVFGNRGQVDYAAANDALDALAHDADGGRLAGRVLSIDWGPWGGTGMVSDELARAYARRGVGLVEPHDGLASLGAELARLRATGRFPAAQVIVARALPERFAAPAGGDGT